MIFFCPVRKETDNVFRKPPYFNRLSGFSKNIAGYFIFYFTAQPAEFMQVYFFYVISGESFLSAARQR